MLRFFTSKRSNGECQPALEVETLEQQLARSRNEYHLEVSRLTAMEKAFKETDFSETPVEQFQQREAEIRQCRLQVESKKSAYQELETCFFENRKLQEQAFVREQKRLRIEEIDKELAELHDHKLPEARQLLVSLPIRIDELGHRFNQLLQERATLL